MGILNPPVPSNGQPLLPARGSATQNAHQHLAMAQFNPSNNSSLVAAMISDIGSKKIECIKVSDTGFTPVAQSFLCSPSDNKQFVRIDDATGSLDRYVPSRPVIVPSVSVSSAVKLDTGQIELIARKMQKLTGFRNLRLQNVVDPSLIAGFTVCYGDNECNAIDLSVRGQLAALAACIESSELSIANDV